MNALIIGLGAAGKRHKRVLTTFGANIFTVSNHTAPSHVNFRLIQDAIKAQNFDYIIIANEPSKHELAYETVRSAGFQGKVLIEKPLNFKRERSQMKLYPQTFVGFNLRYLGAVKYLRGLLAEIESEIIQVNLNYGNSTDNWRIGENKETSYSRSVIKGGGVLRDFCHEIDLASWIFGVQDLQYAYGSRIGTYMIDGEDYVKLLLTGNQKFLVEITLNSLQKIPSRNIQIVTHTKNIGIDLLSGIVSINNNIESIENSIDQTYFDMHNDILNLNSASIATVQDGLLVDKIIGLAEQCMQQNRGKL
jgi:predicted dehydrogenase